MPDSPYRWYTPVLLAFGGLALLLALLVYPVKRYLPGDQKICQELPFRILENSPTDAASWKAFAFQQQGTLEQLARQTAPPLEAYLSFKVSDPAPKPTLTVYLRRRFDPMVTAAFEKLVAVYAQSYTARQQTLAAADAVLGPAGEAEGAGPGTEPDWLKQRTTRYDQIQKQLLELQTEYNRLNVESVALEHQLAPRRDGDYPVGFELAVQPQLEQAVSEDPLIRDLLGKLDEVRPRMADLDTRAGQADSNAALADIDQQRRQLKERAARLREQINFQKQLVMNSLEERLWPQYKLEMEKQIKQKHEMMANNSARQEALQQELKRILEGMAAVPSTLRQELVRPVGTSSGQANSIRQAIQANQPRAFRAALEQLPPMAQTTLLSRVQKVALVLIGVLGALLGMGLYGILRRKEKTEDREQRTEDKKQETEIRGQEAVATTAEPAALAVIDLSQDQSAIPGGSEAEATGWAPPYDRLADIVEPLRDEFACPIVLLTALNPGDASPRVAVNLAIALAKRNRRVLLVQADKTAADLAAIFELPEAPGFFEWRRGEAWVSQVTRATQLAGFTVMPTGNPTDEQNEPDIDLSKEAHRWANLRNNFDVVLLHSPAALAPEPQMPEQIAAAHLRDLADAALCFTAEVRRLGLPQQKAGAEFEGHRARFLGIVAIRS